MVRKSESQSPEVTLPADRTPRRCRGLCAPDHGCPRSSRPLPGSVPDLPLGGSHWGSAPTHAHRQRRERSEQPCSHRVECEGNVEMCSTHSTQVQHTRAQDETSETQRVKRLNGKLQLPGAVREQSDAFLDPSNGPRKPARPQRCGYGVKLLTKAATYTLYTGSAHTMDRTLQQAPTTSAGALGVGGAGAAPALSPWASSSAPLTSWERRRRAISRTLQFLENRQPTSSVPNTCGQTRGRSARRSGATLKHLSSACVCGAEGTRGRACAFTASSRLDTAEQGGALRSGRPRQTGLTPARSGRPRLAPGVRRAGPWERTHLRTPTPTPDQTRPRRAPTSCSWSGGSRGERGGEIETRHREKGPDAAPRAGSGGQWGSHAGSVVRAKVADTGWQRWDCSRPSGKIQTKGKTLVPTPAGSRSTCDGPARARGTAGSPARGKARGLHPRATSLGGSSLPPPARTERP